MKILLRHIYIQVVEVVECQDNKQCVMNVPVSQVDPMTPVGHLQENMLICGVEQVAPFWHGLLKHSSISIKHKVQN